MDRCFLCGQEITRRFVAWDSSHHFPVKITVFLHPACARIQGEFIAKQGNRLEAQEMAEDALHP